MSVNGLGYPGYTDTFVPVIWNAQVGTPASPAPSKNMGKHMGNKPLWAAEAARRLGIPTRELIRLMYVGEIRYTMVDGIAHVTEDAIEEYKANTAKED